MNTGMLRIGGGIRAGKGIVSKLGAGLQSKSQQFRLESTIIQSHSNTSNPTQAQNETNIHQKIKNLIPPQSQQQKVKRHPTGADLIEGANEQEGLEGLGIEEMINLRDMVEAGVHLGHSTKIWNALNIHTIFGERNGIHVINLEHTIAALRRAAKVVESIAYNGGIILFVGTRANIRDVVIDAAYSSGQYYVVDRWIPGTLTNSRLMTGQQLMGSESYVKLVPDYQPPKTIKKNTDDGEVNTNDGGSSSAELGEEKKKQVGDKGGNSRYMKNTTGQRRGDTEDEDYHVMPDLIVSFNPTDVTNTLLAEAQRCLIPTVGVVDTNFDPRKVTYGIPGNDDSSSSIGYIAKVLSKAAYLGKQRRINQAYKGQ